MLSIDKKFRYFDSSCSHTISLLVENKRGKLFTLVINSYSSFRQYYFPFYLFSFYHFEEACVHMRSRVCYEIHDLLTTKWSAGLPAHTTKDFLMALFLLDVLLYVVYVIIGEKKPISGWLPKVPWKHFNDTSNVLSTIANSFVAIAQCSGRVQPSQVRANINSSSPHCSPVPSPQPSCSESIAFPVSSIPGKFGVWPFNNVSFYINGS